MSKVIIKTLHKVGALFSRPKTIIGFFTAFSLVTSCTNNIPNNSDPKNENVSISAISSKYIVRGKAEFPTKPQTPSLGLTPKGRGTNNSPFEGGKGDVSSSLLYADYKDGERSGARGLSPLLKGEFKTQASLDEVADKATVSLIYPPDNPSTPNVTIATGLTDSSGDFELNPTITFTPNDGELFVLEAVKRIGGAGNASITIRTYIKRNGNNWDSMTTPGLYINTTTTALAVIDSYDSNIDSGDTISTIDVSGEPLVSTPSDIGSPVQVTAQTILNVKAFVNTLIGQSVDPVRNISFESGEYFVNTEPNHSVVALNQHQNCPYCDLKHENLRNQDYNNLDLSNADFTEADLTNTDLSDADLTNAILSGADITGAILTGANFTGATWTDGTTICASGSIGSCN